MALEEHRDRLGNLCVRSFTLIRWAACARKCHASSYKYTIAAALLPHRIRVCVYLLRLLHCDFPRRLQPHTKAHRLTANTSPTSALPKLPECTTNRRRQYRFGRTKRQSTATHTGQLFARQLCFEPNAHAHDSSIEQIHLLIRDDLCEIQLLNFARIILNPAIEHTQSFSQV
jgi:hypothetical protein